MEASDDVEQGDPRIRKAHSMRGRGLTRAWSSMRRQQPGEKHHPKGRRSSMFMSSRRLIPEEEILDIGAVPDFEEADEEERDVGNIFVVQEEEEQAEKHVDLSGSTVDASNLYASTEAVGSHLLTRNMFYLEVASNARIRVAVIFVYVVFFVTMTLQIIFALDDQSGTEPMAILPSNSTSLCELQVDGTCAVYNEVNLSEAVLLVNTGVVSEGINVSDWEGYGVKPDTPPFTAHQIFFASFLSDSSFLDAGANPQLQPYWDDVLAMAWVGYRGLDDKRYRVIYLDMEFERLDGQDWPSDIADEPFPVRIEGYACLTGDDCDNIGNWRLMIVDDVIDYNPVRKVRGNIFEARLAIYSHYLGEEMVDSLAWRLAILSDPGGCVTEALTVNETSSGVLARFGTSGERVYPTVVAIGDVIVLAAYVGFFSWWLYSLRKQCGRFGEWAKENKWLFYASLGFILSVNPIMVGLQLHSTANDSSGFNQSWWCASLIVGAFGSVMVYVVFALFSDAPRRFVTSRWDFYGWKVAFCLAFFITYALVQVFRFPTIWGWDEPGTESELGGQGYVTAPENWYRKEQTTYAVLMSFLIAFLVFTYFYYAWANRRSRKVLDTLPYALSRPMQLSSRFFLWVTSLWVLANFVLLLFGVLRAVYDNGTYFNHLDGLSSYVVAVERMHLLQGGYARLYHDIFAFAFLVIFQCFYLPPECFGGSSEKSKTHYISEEDAAKNGDPKEFLMVLELTRLLMVCSKEVYLPFESDYAPPKSPKQTSSETKSSIGSGVTKVARAVKEKLRTTTDTPSKSCGGAKDASEDDPEVEPFSARHETGDLDVEADSPEETLGDASAEEYSGGQSDSESECPPVHSEPQMPETRFAGGSGSAPGYLPWESTLEMGCTVVAHVSEPEGSDMHNTRAMILRRTETNDLIVTFRGTLTKKQVQTDVMSSRIFVDLDTFLTTTAPKRCWKGENRTGEAECVSPDVIEAKIRSGEIKKIRLVDLLPKQGKGGVPDYLESATKISDGIDGVGQIHFGFWSSYNRVRRQVHTVVREELLASPGRLLITGHSLGGAQATLCAYDMCRYVLPTVQSQFEESNRTESIKIACYTFGSPRVGCRAFKVAYNKMMPDTQRIVNDGDVITAMPPARLGFRHVGRENIFDRVGSIRVNPSLIEKKFTRSKNEVIPHKMDSYREVVVKSFNPVTDESQLLETIRKGYYSDNPRCAYCNKNSTGQ